MRELQQFAFVHFLASAMTQTSNVPKAINQADLAMKALDQRFPGGEDREVVDLREIAEGLREKLVEANNHATTIIEERDTLAADLKRSLEAGVALAGELAAATAGREA